MTRRTGHLGSVIAAGLSLAGCVLTVNAQQVVPVNPDSPFAPQQPEQSADAELDAVDDRDVAVPQELRAIVSRFDSQYFADREKALQDFVNFGADIQQVRTMLRSGAISLEQRHRLLSAARMNLVERPRGALGISMPRGQMPVKVNGLLPDLPAQHVLRINDLITHIDDIEIANAQELIRAAQERLPGESLDLTVQRVRRDDMGNALRDEEGLLLYDEMKIAVVLGSAEKLLDQNGFVQRDGPVIEERERRANQLTLNFGDHSRVLRLDPAVDPAKTRGRVIAKTNDEFKLVEQHRYVQAIIREKKKIADGRIRRSTMTQVWQTRLSDLQQQINNRSNSRKHRKYLTDVYNRCAELMIDRR